MSFLRENTRYQICKRCVMDTSDPLILFDDSGLCNHCNDFISRRMSLLKYSTDNRLLKELFEKIKRDGRAASYDCVIGVSGGVDSSYLTLLAVQNGLRVLAVHMDNGWDSLTSVENISTIVNSLKVDYTSYVLPWADFREVQLAFLNASVPEVETPTDVAIQRAVHHTANKFKVKYILSGGNLATEGILPASWHYNARDTKYTYSILKAQNCEKFRFSKMKYGLMEEFYYKIAKGIKTVYPLNFLPYDRKQAQEALERDMGWKDYGFKHGESKFTKFIQSYYLPIKHGIDYRRATLSSEICRGSISRSEAVEILNHPLESIEVNKPYNDYIIKKLEISQRQFNEILSAPPKWYWNIPNNSIILSQVYDIYRYLYKKEKTSNF